MTAPPLPHRIIHRIVAVATLLVALMAAAGPGFGGDQDPCHVTHPFAPPQAAFSGECAVCGMTRSMWARTFMTFTDAKGEHMVCSINCLAAMNIDHPPQDVRTALYLDPERMIPGPEAVFVVDSSARGTMTHRSKLAFPSRDSAEAFVKTCGGTIHGFDETLEMARQEILAKQKQGQAGLPQKAGAKAQ